jgi:GT2 family glycosyltransferase
MSCPISIVIPSLFDRELLVSCLEPLLEEVRSRGSIDQVLVIDDSGRGQLAAWLEGTYPTVEVLIRETNGGFAAALTSGVEAATFDYLFALNPDVRIRPGCFAPLIEDLADPVVLAVSPYVLLHGEASSEESLPELLIEEGFPVIRHAPLVIEPGRAHPAYPGGIPVTFALGGAFLFRKADYLARPFDPRFAPFYWEDVDWCQEGIAAGRRVLVDPRAVAEHHHRGTIAPRIPAPLVRAAIEKNRLLFAWKHFTDPDLRRTHLEALTARVLEHGICEEREELTWLLLALEQVGE